MPRVVYKKHNDILFELQEKYLKNRDSIYLVEMYNVFVEMSFNMINKYLRVKGVSMPYYDVVCKSNDMATMMIEKYLKNEKFKLTSSPSGYLRNSTFLSVMFGYKDDNQCLSLEQLQEDMDKESYKCQ